MSLRVRASRISVITEQGRFSNEVRFDDGVSFIQADNNMGKTTTLMSVLYALGWEGMLGPSHHVPLTPAVTSEIADARGGRLSVLESSVTVELEGQGGKRLTLRRPIVSESERRELVHTWDGPALTEPDGDYRPQDHYVRMPGAARREAGLHARLAEFVGWELPEVTRWDGSTTPLYMEFLAPFLFVEQTRGWAWIASVMPRYLRVRDPERRSIEFLLLLDSLTRGQERDTLTTERNELRSQWLATVQAFGSRVQELGGLLENVPGEPTADWPPISPPGVRLLVDDEWQPIVRVLEGLRAELALATRKTPTVDSVADVVAVDLRAAEERANHQAGLVAARTRDEREQRGELKSLEERLAALREDRTRYDDAIRLRDLGSLAPLALERPLCPTCEQRLPPTLLGSDLGQVMTLEDNRALIDEEMRTFGAMRDDAESVLRSSRQLVLASRYELDESRGTIRSLKSTLTQASGAPSRAAIERQIRIEDRIEKLQAVEKGLAGLNATLSEQAVEQRRVAAALAGLGRRGGQSNDDRQKLEALAALIREQLSDYGFTSVPAEEIQLTPDTYLPMRAEEPVRPDELSASDRVRMVWAYLIGLLEMSRHYETAHPGLLVLDEPGQQDISDASLQALFRRLANTEAFNQQAIIATSKRADVVRALTAGVPVSIDEVPGYVLQRETLEL
jgi:hypothetical protein